MKTIEEHNKDVQRKYDDRYATGVQCPHCGDEMKYTSPDVMLLSNPPKKDVKCFTCNYTTTIYV